MDEQIYFIPLHRIRNVVNKVKSSELYKYILSQLAKPYA